MFYIHRPKLIRRREVLFLHTLPTVVVFIAFLVVTLISWGTAQNAIRNEQLQAVRTYNAQTSASIKQRLDSYEDILRGASGLFEASENVNRQEWREYLNSYDMTNRYPGIQGLGYIEVIPPSSLQSHLDRVRAEGYPNYSVFPSGDREIYTSVLYIEPFTESNKRLFGYDLYSETVRMTAMEKARDTGELTISDVVTLTQDGDSSNAQPGFLMFLPIYSGTGSPTTTEERQARLTGYVYASFRSYDLVDQTLNQINENYGVQIFTIQPDSKFLIYENPNFKQLNSQTDMQTQKTEVTLSGIKWDVEGVASPEVVNSNVRNRPTSIIWGGLIFSFLVAGFIYLLLKNRSRDLAEKEEQGIQDAKDELLALASHQLRTPATGVKQYIGMILEGFAGDVSEFQRQLLNKAYESNERQLGTINEMLFVARSDAGQLELNFNNFNLSELLTDIVDEQKDVIKEKKQKITIKTPKRSIYYNGDKQYLRMAVENVISNATKYTKDRGKITVSLKGKKENVTIQVSDNGVGVPPEHVNLLFKKFSRIPNELTGKVVGSGIGLYLAKQIVDKHKGNITFEPGETVGSVVTITLPIQKIKKSKSKFKPKNK
jgi:signal transduction histidine kinase